MEREHRFCLCAAFTFNHIQKASCLPHIKYKINFFRNLEEPLSGNVEKKKSWNVTWANALFLVEIVSHD